MLAYNSVDGVILSTLWAPAAAGNLSKSRVLQVLLQLCQQESCSDTTLSLSWAGCRVSLLVT